MQLQKTFLCKSLRDTDTQRTEPQSWMQGFGAFQRPGNNLSYFTKTTTKKHPRVQFCRMSEWRMGHRVRLGLLIFEAGFRDAWRGAALIFTTSSHFCSSCQRQRQSVSHSYAATDGPIPPLQLSCWHDSWSSVSWFRVPFIFLLASGTEAFLCDIPEAATQVCLACCLPERHQEKRTAWQGKNGHTQSHFLSFIV